MIPLSVVSKFIFASVGIPAVFFAGSRMLTEDKAALLIVGTGLIMLALFMH